MKTHNVELMQNTYNRNDSDVDRAAQVLELVEDVRESGDTDAMLKRSVIAKLCSLKDADGVSLYKKAAKVSVKTGKPSVSKADIVGVIAGLMGMAPDAIDSFASATKVQLQAFANTLAEAKEQADTQDGNEEQAEDVPTANA